MKAIFWGILCGISAATACSSDHGRPGADGGEPDGAPQSGGAAGMHASGGSGGSSGGTASGGHSTGGNGGAGAAGSGGRPPLDGSVTGGSTSSVPDASDARVGHDAGTTTDAGLEASSDAGDGGRTVTFNITFDGNGVIFVDTAATDPPMSSSPVRWRDDTCFAHDLTTVSSHQQTWRIPASNCGVEFLIQIFPSYTYSYVNVTPGSALSCTAHLDNGVGEYFDCMMNAQSNPTTFEINASQTPLTNAGTDFHTFVH